MKLVQHYDEWAPAMQNRSRFYDWVLREVRRLDMPPSSRILDIGCGTGTLLSRLYQDGFTALAGIDFSPGCLALTKQSLQGIDVHIRQFDIESGPLNEEFDLIFMTTVIDFLADPGTALQHTQQSLATKGIVILTIRNRLAYFPWYYLRPVVRSSRWPAQVAHWLAWFTLPLPMRRSDQPLEHMYSLSEMRSLLSRNGFRIVNERAAAYFPMLRIPGVVWLERAVDRADRFLQRLPATPLGYEYMFICEQQKVSAATPSAFCAKT